MTFDASGNVDISARAFNMSYNGDYRLQLWLTRDDILILAREALGDMTLAELLSKPKA